MRKRNIAKSFEKEINGLRSKPEIGFEIGIKKEGGNEE
jgi:hypothetical protein